MLYKKAKNKKGPYKYFLFTQNRTKCNRTTNNSTTEKKITFSVGSFKLQSVDKVFSVRNDSDF